VTARPGKSSAQCTPDDRLLLPVLSLLRRPGAPPPDALPTPLSAPPPPMPKRLGAHPPPPIAQRPGGRLPLLLLLSMLLFFRRPGAQPPSSSLVQIRSLGALPCHPYSPCSSRSRDMVPYPPHLCSSSRHGDMEVHFQNLQNLTFGSMKYEKFLPHVSKLKLACVKVFDSCFEG
jgi:hypothetical protein